MKKIVLFFAIMATGVCANAQVNTLYLGDRDPVYLYGDWWDNYALHDSIGKTIYWYESYMLFSLCKVEYARYCYTDTSLRIIGIAAALSLGKSLPYDYRQYVWDIPDSFFYKRMVPEYFRLYEVDSLGDEMTLMAEGEFDPSVSWTQPRHVIQTGYNPEPVTQTAKVYEVYFDIPVTVYDSFYVGITGNNCYEHLDFNDNSPLEDSYGSALLVTTDAVSTAPSYLRPHPNHYKRKLHLLDSRNYDHRYGITDTNWHTFDKAYNLPNLEDPPDWNRFMYLFPIFDTSKTIACQPSGSLSLAYLDGSVATLTWSGGYNADHWELSLCPDGCEPEDGTVTQWNAQLATVQGLDTARWYEARVRTVCHYNDSNYYSEWSDSLRFYVPGDTAGGGTDPISIESIDDQYTYLMPNPASGTVTVASSFRIAEVEVYTLDGRSVLRQRVDGISTVLDISALPAATYLVRVATGHGTAFKKLVVK